MRSVRRALLAAGLTMVVGIAAAQAPSVTQEIAEGSTLYKNGKTPQALEKFVDLLNRYPDNPDVQSWTGFLYLQSGTPDKAVAPLEKASVGRPNDAEILNNLGNAYFQTKQYDKALVRYEQVSSKAPSMFEPHYNAGVNL